jgi:hypothetical protein
MSVLHSLLSGLDDETRTRTVTKIAESVAEERALPPDAPRRRAADVGTRRRRSPGQAPGAGDISPADSAD